MEKGLTIDYKCRRCGERVSKPANDWTVEELREAIVDHMFAAVVLHECSRRMYGVADLVGYSLPLED